MQIRQCLLEATALLADYSDSAKRDVEWIFLHTFKKDRVWLRLHEQEEMSAEDYRLLQEKINRRKQGEPVAYIIGEQGFWDFVLKVSPATLIPRPETELLVEWVLEKAENFSESSLRILDLGTGTGAIALAIKKMLPKSDVYALDASQDALAVAQENARALNLNVNFMHSNWFENVLPQKFHIIVSNPPYIDAQDEHLQQGDVRFEPRTALVAANNGLADIEKVIQQASSYLYTKGYLAFEHGYQQAKDVRELFQQAQFAEIQSCSDLQAHERITYACWREGQ
jgi:release factor glutamine methyltransferase